MKFSLFFILSVVFICSAELIMINHDHDPNCEGFYVSGKFHKKHIIANGLNRPYQLSIYNNHHTIYFSYNVGRDDEDKFEIGYLKKNQKEPTPIPEVKNGFATTIDHHHGISYLGGSEGIYAHEYTNPDEIKHVLKEHNIWDMFYKEHLYFIVYPSQRLHKKHENGSELVEHINEKIYQFAIDGDEDIFITTANGVFQIKNGTKERISFTGPNIFRAIEVDHQGVAHFCGQNGIYVANKDNNALEEIAHIKNIFGLTFDEEDHIIYSDPHEIVKLLPDTCK